jgi:CHAD domain-containing protein
MQFRQWALKIATSLGRVRDYDVMQEWLKVHASDAEQNQTFQAARDRVWRVTRPKLKLMSRRQRNQLCSWDSSEVKSGKLRKRFLKQCAKIRAGLNKDAARFEQLDTAGLHEFRRALRRLRYLRELTLKRREQKTDHTLKQIIAFQEALGEMQNCSVVRSFYSSPPHSKPRMELAERARIDEQKWLRRSQPHLRAFISSGQSI